MSMTIFKGILIPFLGTSLGAACVLFMKKNLHYLVQRALTGFAAGVMVAAGVWSLLIPSMEQSAKMGRLRFVPAAVGFMLGVFFLLFLEVDFVRLFLLELQVDFLLLRLKKLEKISILKL